MTDIVFPGDFLANAEEFGAGVGTYVHNDKVFASTVGQLERDMKGHEVRVKPLTRQPTFQREGDTVLGFVAESTDKAAFVDLAEVKDGRIVRIPNPASTVLRVNSVSTKYVKSLKDEVKTGDLVRAKIVEATPTTIAISIKEDGLGVIKAFCSGCRYGLRSDGAKLICDNCGKEEQRKTAPDYGSGKV